MRPTAKEFWDRRAAVYDADAGVFYREAYEKTTACMRKYLKLTDTVLDFACGTGIVTLSLSPDVKELRGIDISNEMIRRAQGKAAAQGIANVLLTQTDLFDDSLAPASFDAVLACNVLLDLGAFLQRIREVLRQQLIGITAPQQLGHEFTIHLGHMHLGQAVVGRCGADQVGCCRHAFACINTAGSLSRQAVMQVFEDVPGVPVEQGHSEAREKTRSEITQRM